MERIVYKYLPLERLTYLDDELIRITQPEELNDPFECYPFPPTIEQICLILEETLAKRIKDIHSSKFSKNKKIELKLMETRRFKSEITKVKKNVLCNYRSKFTIDTNQIINGILGILSLSRRWNSSLMWAHYTNAHKGFCVGFDARNPFFADYNKLEDKEKIFMPVNYSNERIKVPIELGEKIDPNIMLTKSKDWVYEDEERLLLKLALYDKKISATPYDIFLIKLPHLLIKEIIAGAKIPQDSFKRLEDFSKTHNIPLYRSEMSETKFDMERKLFEVG